MEIGGRGHELVHNKNCENHEQRKTQQLNSKEGHGTQLNAQGGTVCRQQRNCENRQQRKTQELNRKEGHGTQLKTQGEQN